MYIDSHCHINNLSAVETENVFKICAKDYLLLDSSIDLATTAKSLALANANDFVFASLGFHPFSLKQFDLELIQQYQDLIERNDKVVAIGEIGLDDKSGFELKQQIAVLEKFIALALNNQLPVSLHNRLNQPTIFDILNSFFVDYQKVVFHCFSYGPKILELVLKKGGTVSFSLNILRKQPELLEAIKLCPLNNILLETDSPYMKVNNRYSTPLDLNLVYDFVAVTKKISLDELKAAVAVNAKRVFNFKKQ